MRQHYLRLFIVFSGLLFIIPIPCFLFVYNFKKIYKFLNLIKICRVQMMSLIWQNCQEFKFSRSRAFSNVNKTNFQ